jgi:hypothetical protein
MKLKKRHLIAGFSGLATAAVLARLLVRPRDVELEKNRHRIYHAEYSQLTTVDGIRVHYQEAGDPAGPALFLVHGFLSSTFVWSKVFLELAAAGFRVIAPDLIGYGYSAKPRDFDYTIESQARVMAGLIKRLGCEGATLILRRRNLQRCGSRSPGSCFEISPGGRRFKQRAETLRNDAARTHAASW